MKPHIIDEKGYKALEEMRRNHKILMAKATTQSGYTKCIYGYMRYSFTVELAGEVKYEGMQLRDAVAAYNELL